TQSVGTRRKAMSKRADNPPPARQPAAPPPRPEETPPPRHRADGFALTDQDLYLFNEGSHFQLYDKLGAHPVVEGGKVTGTSFAVWAPNAREVHVMGEFNGWNKSSHPLHARGQSGIWQNVIPGVGPGTVYKYHIASHHNGYRVEKADPFAVYSEVPPRTGPVGWPPDYEGDDPARIARRSP